MTVLDATVEIVKALVTSSNGSTSSILTTPGQRKELLDGIKELHTTLNELEKNKAKESRDNFYKTK